MQHLLSLVVAVALSSLALAEKVWIVRDGKPAADVYAGSSEWSTAERFVERIENWTGAKLVILGSGEAPPGRKELTRVLIGTVESLPALSPLLKNNAAHTKLSRQGFSLRAEPGLIVMAGRSLIGARYAMGELLNYRLEVSARDVWCEPFETAEQPALPYRWLWLSTSYAHWDASYGGPHATDEVAREFGPHPDGSELTPTRYPGQSLGLDAYRNTYRAMVDWMTEHKLNGSLIFGYLNSGLDAGREVAAYAKQQGVDILAGVGTMGYWGTYYGGTNEYNLDTLMKLRPELTRKNERGAVTVCPSLAEMRAYWRAAGRWIAESIPELGGLYLENGDLQTCPCEACKANRAKDENDTKCYWDMMASEVPVIEGAAAVHPDWKFVYATYTSFSPAAFKTGTDRTPPRFPAQFQPFAICQWTVTGMNESNWPESLRAPTAHNVGLFHSPSVWGRPDGKDRWWAGPGSSHDDASRLVRFYCSRMATAGFEGLVVKGMKNHHSPGPLLTYLALGEFSWHPQLTMEEWEQKRLGILLGGRERARLYLHLARDESRDKSARQRLTAQAREVSAAADLSPRARPYWQDLAAELDYRIRLLETIEAKARKETP